MHNIQDTREKDLCIWNLHVHVHYYIYYCYLNSSIIDQTEESLIDKNIQPD